MSYPENLNCFFVNTSSQSVISEVSSKFLAIHLHLRYQELVTHKRVVAVVILIWVLSVFLSLMVLWLRFDVSGLSMLIVGVLGLLVIVGVYVRICLVARRHKNQIAQVQRFAHAEEIGNVARVVKSAFGIFYVFLFLSICYLPSFIGMVVYQIYGPSIPLKKVMFFSWTLLNLNSSMNAFIYCWKMAHIRHAILNTLRNMSWLRNAWRL